MAARAAADSTLNEQSVNESNDTENTSKPAFVSSLSRTSVTFFSGDNASQVARQKFEALKEAALDGKTPSENGDKQEENEDEEQKIVAAILNHVRFIRITLFLLHWECCKSISSK